MAAEKKRGCGYRKIGGIYLCADGPGEPCHRLPIPLEVCPTCHHGVKQTRGWTWIKPEILGGDGDCQPERNKGIHCMSCVACTPNLLGEKAGLIWIGEKFYKTPEEFTREAIEQGISRRVTAIPKGFKVGEHFILVAHPRAVLLKSVQTQDLAGVHHEDTFGAGIFHVFRPSRIEKILPDNASAEEIKEWQDRGCTVVQLPHDDKDHQGSVYDKSEDEPEEATEAGQ